MCGCCSPGAQLYPFSDLVLFIYCVTLAWRLFTVGEVTIGATVNRTEQDVPFMIYDDIVFLLLSFNYLFSIKIRLSCHFLANFSCLDIKSLMKVFVLVPTWNHEEFTNHQRTHADDNTNSKLNQEDFL